MMMKEKSLKSIDLNKWTNGNSSNMNGGGVIIMMVIYKSVY